MKAPLTIAAGGLIAIVGSAASAQAPVRTVQQDFEAATALDAGPDRAAALAAWEALEKRTRPGSRSNAIVLVREGTASFRMDRHDEARRLIRSGLVALPATDATLREDRFRAFVVLGRIAAATLDYAGAAAAFIDAGALAIDPAERLGVLIALIEVQTFTDPVAAAASLDRADVIAGAVKLDKVVAASLARRRAELLLNIGDFAAAQRSAIRAVTLLGGLTDQTDLNDVSARSDAAIAFLMAGNAQEARRYMAATGAGRLPKGSFDPAAQMIAPDCGGEAGLRPQDVAVVEFNIAADGTVARAVPVYAAGGGKVALEYARAVRGWSWSPQVLAAMPSFFRYNARVEMRCSTAFARPSIGDGLDASLERWLATRVPIAAAPEGSVAAALPAQRAALAAAEANGASSLTTLAALYRLASNPVVPREEQAAFYARGAAIAAANDAPAQARLAMELPARLLNVGDRWRPGTYARTVMPLLSMPIYASDPAARAAIRLMLVDQMGTGGSTPPAARADAMLLLRQVVDDAALAANDPLRIGALLRIASLEQGAGDAAKARAAFEASGISASQCAILDAPPKMISTPGSDAFPMEAMRWGFEGWVQVQYDVGADGRATAPRALLSYPPFIFSTAGTKFLDTARFAKTYRPDGGIGCGGSTNRIKFLLPQ